MKANTETDQNLGIFRKPTLEDGAQVWELVKSTGVLDLNSSYQYLMWCQYFSDTSVVVEQDGKIVGCISGFTNQQQTNTLFVWQVAVHESHRAKGLATNMIHYMLDQDDCKTINYVEATISPSNIPSQKLFQGLARDLNTDIKVSDCSKASDFPETGHEDEDSHLIGPFNQ